MKDLSVIPKNTDYCYEIININQKTGKIKTKLCPYWSRNGCSFLKMNIKDSILLWDQVKECGIGEPDEY